jgi:hypothetical protein
MASWASWIQRLNDNSERSRRVRLCREDVASEGKSFVDSHKGTANHPAHKEFAIENNNTRQQCFTPPRLWGAEKRRRDPGAALRRQN